MTIGYPAPGTEVAGYRIEQLLGRGGMGEVYRALDVRLGRPVALKLLVAGAAPERLLRESRLAARLDHPNVVPIYEAGEAGRPALHRDALRRRRRPEGVAAARGRARPCSARSRSQRRSPTRSTPPTGAASCTATSSRATSCSTSEDGREHCYLADFGLTQSGTDRGPADGHGMGTIDYVAPEQIRGEPLDGRADQYALACLLFECSDGIAAVSLTLGRRRDLRPPRGARPAPRANAEAELPRRDRRRAGARHGEGRPTTGSTAAAASVAARATRSGSPRRRGRRAPARRARLAAVLVVAAVASRSCCWGAGRPARPAPTGSLTPIDPRTNRVPQPHRACRATPASSPSTPGGIWMADFRGRRALALRARCRRACSASRPTASHATSPRSATRCTSPPTGDFLSGVGLPLRRLERRARGQGSTCSRARSRRARAWSGRRAARSCSGSARTKGTAAQAGQGLPAVPARRRRSTNARVQFRELAIGAGSLWVLGDALDRRMWRLDAHTGRIQATIELGFPPHFRGSGHGGTVWITDGLNDRSSRWTPRRAARLPRSRRSRRERHCRRFGRRVGREHARRHGVARRSA